ncbi:MAG TPA: NosD domain-containing protein [Lysobacter sp.]
MNHAPLCLPVFAVLLGLSCAARAETRNCTEINALPAIISSQGVYCLKQDLTTAISSGFAVRINANNVTLDCNGHKIGGLAAGAGTQARGIYGAGSFPNYLSNVVVRNCGVRGFATGIELYGSGHVVEDNRLDANTTFGIKVTADDSVIRRNRVNDTGGNTLADAPIGINAISEVDVLDNTVSRVFASAGSNDSADGIYTQTDRYSVVRGNRVRGVAADGSGAPHGIFAFSAGRLILDGNHLVNASGNGSAITCNQTDDAIVLNNVLNGFTFTMPGCLDGGGNVVVAP